MSTDHPRLGARIRELVIAWQHTAYNLEHTSDANETDAETANRTGELARLELCIMELRDVLDGKPNLFAPSADTIPERVAAVHRAHCDPTGCQYGDDDCPVVTEHEAAENAIDSLSRADAMRRRLDTALLDLADMGELQTSEIGARMIRYAHTVVSHVIALDDYHVLASTRKAPR